VPSSWGSNGFAYVEAEAHTVDVQGAAQLLLYQFNDKVLPGSTRDEEVRKRVEKLQEQQGRKIGKKEYREVRDEVEMTLLTKAMIRRSFVPVLIVDDYIMVFTSSAKKADMVATALMVAYGPNADKAMLLHNLVHSVVLNPGNLLRPVAQAIDVDTGGGVVFSPTSSVVLKGAEKQVIRIKDKSVNSHDVQELLKQDYSVESVGMDVTGPVDASFVVTDKLIFKGIKIEGVKPDKDEDAKFNNIWLVAQAMETLLDNVIESLDGLGEVTELAVEENAKKEQRLVVKFPAAPAEDDDEI